MKHLTSKQAFANVAGHEVGRTGTAWRQFYIATPDGRVGLIDDSDWQDAGLPWSCLLVTAQDLETMLASVWHWEETEPEDG